MIDFLYKKYPLDWYGLWEYFDENPHIHLSTDQVLKIEFEEIVSASSSTRYLYVNLKLLTDIGWVILHRQPVNRSLSLVENNASRNQAIHKLMQYAEYLFAGKQPGPKQSNIFPKWQFAKEI